MATASLDKFNELDTEETFYLQNPYLLKIEVDGEIIAKKGSMVAYQGDTKFQHQSAGLGRLAKKIVSSDSVDLMTVSGSGDLFLAEDAKHVQVIRLENQSVFVDPSSVLAFEASVDWDLSSTGKVSSIYAAGLWQMKLHGTGYVAFLTKGDPVKLDCSNGTFVDKQAVVAWSDGMEMKINKDTSFKTFTGRASGESVQLQYRGAGWVLVQPAERYPMTA